MKKLGVVLQYELMTYLKNKSYVISTVIIALIAVIYYVCAKIYRYKCHYRNNKQY